MKQFLIAIAPVAVLTTVVFGAALVWVTHYAEKRGLERPGLGRLRGARYCGYALFALGSLTIAASLLHVGALLLAAVAVAALFMTAIVYRRSQREMLFWSIGCAARRGLPLADAVRALADVHGPRCERVAENLESGLSLSTAIGSVYSFPSIDTAMAVRTASRYGGLERLSQVITPDEYTERITVDRAAVALLYALIVVLALTAVASFIFARILPLLDEMQLQLLGDIDPAQAGMVNWLGFWDRHGSTVLNVLVPAALLLLMAILHYLGILSPNMPLFNRFGLPLDRACLMQSLATALEGHRPLNESLRFLAVSFPKTLWGSRLHNAADQIEQGKDWLASLRQARLLSNADVPVLRAAQAARNLPWAWRELAGALRRRYVHRQHLTFQTILSLSLLTLGSMVFVTTVTVFAPLIRLIQGLAT
jgi:type II secretory pathway component PulF